MVLKKNLKKQDTSVDDEIHTEESAATASQDTTNNSNTGSLGGTGMMGMGMGYSGMGMMSPYSMGMMSPYSMGMMGMGGMGMMGSQWLFSLNQFLFGIQSVVFSLGQAVQIVGMNAQQMKQMYESVKGMVENAIGQVNQWGQMDKWEEITGLKGEEARRWMMGGDYDEDEIGGTKYNNSELQHGVENRRERKILTQNEIIRRRRVAAFRWTVTLTISYFLYKGVRRLIRMLLFGSRGNGRRQLASSDMQQQYRMGGMTNQYYGGGMGMGGQGGYGMSRYSSYGGGGYGRRNYNAGYDAYGGGGGDYY